jgi:hypothetical protein
MKLSELFDLKVAKSKGNEDYDDGNIPYVSSTTMNNGVVKFVEPYPEDKVFPGKLICISGLGFATLQLNDFLPKGNGGDSATILIPKQPMTMVELIYYTATFNLLHNWRFSFGRKCSKERIQNLELIPFSEYNGEFNEDFPTFMDLFNNKIDDIRAIVE